MAAQESALYEGEVRSDSLLSPMWSPGTRFIPAKTCVHCRDGITMLVAPIHWPIDSVAKVCYACGRVQNYIDGLLVMSPREAVVEFQARPWAVRRGTALQPSNAEVAREMILIGLEGGLSPAEVAAELNVERQYVLNIAGAAGINV